MWTERGVQANSLEEQKGSEGKWHRGFSFHGSRVRMKRPSGHSRKFNFLSGEGVLTVEVGLHSRLSLLQQLREMGRTGGQIFRDIFVRWCLKGDFRASNMSHLLSTEDVVQVPSGSHPFLGVAGTVVALAMAFRMSFYGEAVWISFLTTVGLSNDPQRCLLPNAQHLRMCCLI